MIKKSRKKEKKKILITGRYGFVGSHLFNFLKKNNNYKICNTNKKFYNLSNYKNFKNIIIKYQPNLIIHLAARTKATIKNKREDKLQYKNTILPVVNLVNSLKYCTELKRIIFFGSIEEYGSAKPPFYEKQTIKPSSSYGIAKAIALKYVQKKIKNNNKIDYIWIRPSLIFGKNDNKKRFLGSLFYSLNFNKKLKVSINSQIRDFLYVKDLCRFVEFLIIKKKINTKIKVLNVTAENWINMNKIFLYFSKNIQNKIHRLVINRPHKKHLDFYSSGRLLKKNFKTFQFTNFKKALNETFRFKN
jgi:nucleoside-diphosphate-sugar epimerase